MSRQPAPQVANEISWPQEVHGKRGVWEHSSFPFFFIPIEVSIVIKYPDKDQDSCSGRRQNNATQTSLKLPGDPFDTGPDTVIL